MPQFFLYFVTPLLSVPDIYLYVIGPIVGALIAALLYDCVRGKGSGLIGAVICYFCFEIKSHKKHLSKVF